MSKQSNLVNTSQDITVDSSGNVGIGTSSPATPLDVTKSGGGNFVATFQNTTSATPYGVHIKDASSGANGYPLLQVTNSAGSSPYLVVHSGTGNVGIGRTPSYRLDVDSVGMSASGRFNRYTDGSLRSLVIFRSSSNGSDVGGVYINNTSTSYNTSSDYRLKTDAQPMTGASARVQALNPVNFEWLSDGTRVDGFLAHEAQDVVPEAVTGEKDAVDADGNPEYQGIDQSKLVPLLTAALQEALTKIDDMETRLAALEAN
jgi:hypothetical protein